MATLESLAHCDVHFLPRAGNTAAKVASQALPVCYRGQAMESPEQSSNSPEDVTPVLRENLKKFELFSKREEEKATPLQRYIERVSHLLGSPVYFVVFIAFCILWIIANLAIHYFGHAYFDEPPFIWLQGIVSLNGVLITMAVLVRQNRLTQIEDKRAKLELQVELLAEQKATKIIQLLEELRHDMPNVKKRDDPHVTTLQETADPEVVLNALEERPPKS
jgi:uncharacterized membrane protein